MDAAQPPAVAPADNDCPTGLFVDGRCDHTKKSGFPADGRYSYYTFYGFWAVAAALLAFLALLAPSAGSAGRAVPDVLAYTVLPFIIAAAVNSIGVFLGAQVLLFKARFGEHLEDVHDDRVTMTLSRYKLRARAEVLVHSVPVVIAVLMIVGLAFFTLKSTANRWVIAALAILWVACGAGAYFAAPVTNRMHGEEPTPENSKRLRGFEKMDFVYGKSNGMVLLVGLLCVAVIGSPVVALKVIK
jgi:hypothetical protein